MTKDGFNATVQRFLESFVPEDAKEKSRWNKACFALAGELVSVQAGALKEERAKKGGGSPKPSYDLDSIETLTQEQREELAGKILDASLLSGEMSISELDRFKDELGLGVKQKEVHLTLIDYTDAPTHYEAGQKPEQ